MPDLNLQEEGSLDNLDNSGDLGEVEAPAEESPVKKGGGMGMILIVVLAVIIVLGGGAFVLNKLGVVHLWGPKPAPAVVELSEPAAEPPAETVAPQQEASQTQMIETPPVDERGKPSAPAEKSKAKPAAPAAKPQAPVHQMPAPQASNVGDMKGEYTVQVSAWREKEIADEMVRRLSEAGYPAFVEGRDYKGGTWYTVRVGRYGSRKEAEEAVQGFGDELKSSYWIDKAKAR